jgi:hypothetical protein
MRGSLKPRSYCQGELDQSAGFGVKRAGLVATLAQLGERLPNDRIILLERIYRFGKFVGHGDSSSFDCGDLENVMRSSARQRPLQFFAAACPFSTAASTVEYYVEANLPASARLTAPLEVPIQTYVATLV